MRLAFAIFVLSIPLRAQILQVDAGAGNLFTGGTMGGGFQAQMYFPTSTISTSMGYANGHVIFGASDQFTRQGYDWTVGSRMVGVSAGGANVALALTGVSIEKHILAQESVVLFAGASGESIFSPYASSGRVQHIAAGGMYNRQFHNHLWLSTLAVVNGGEKSVGQAGGWSYRQKFIASGSVGYLAGKSFLEGSASYRVLPILTLNAGHQTFYTPDEAKSNSVGFSGLVNHIVFSGGVNESTYLGMKSSGEYGTGGLVFRNFQAQAGWYESNSRVLKTYTITDRLTRRLSLTGGVSQSASGTNFNGGGAWTSSRFTVQLTHGVVYLLDGRGYQQTTSGSISIRIRDMVISGQVGTDPFGHKLWSGSSQDYIVTGARLPENRRGSAVAHSGGGRLSVSGVCVLPDNTPVDGCTIQIGKEVAVSDTEGHWETHTNGKGNQKVIVNVNEFTTLLPYELVTAPKTARAGDEVRVIVRRK